MSEIKTDKLSSLTGTNNDITIDPDGTGNTVIASGNVGIGTVPKPFNTVDGALQIGTRQTLTSFSNDVGIGYNHYFNSGWKYTNTDVARRFSSTSTVPFIWQYAASGSADAAITWSEAMRIDGSGNVGIGGSPSELLHIKNASGDAAVRIQGNTRTFNIQQNNYGLRFVDVDAGSAERMRIDSSGNVSIASGGLQAIGVYNNTTGSGANLVVDSGGGFARSTSSMRYKNTINDATHGLTELLALRPVTYKGNNDGDTVFGGLIAEEVHDAGLTEFVTYNDNDEPDALAYSNMVSLCIKAIQEQQATIIALEARIAALEAE